MLDQPNRNISKYERANSKGSQGLPHSYSKWQYNCRNANTTDVSSQEQAKPLTKQTNINQDETSTD